MSPAGTAALSLAVAVVGTLTTEVFLRLRRQEDFSRQCFEKLYGPFLIRIARWFELQTAFRRGHDSTYPESLYDLGAAYIKHVGVNFDFRSPGTFVR